MHKRHGVAASKNKNSASKRFIDKAIFIVAAVQPLATLPQIVAIYRHQDASGVSIGAWVMYLVFDIAWLWYGIVERQKAVIVSSVLFFTLESVVAVGAIMYGGTL